MAMSTIFLTFLPFHLVIFCSGLEVETENGPKGVKYRNEIQGVPKWSNDLPGADFDLASSLDEDERGSEFGIKTGTINQRTGLGPNQAKQLGRLVTRGGRHQGPSAGAASGPAATGVVVKDLAEWAKKRDSVDYYNTEFSRSTQAPGNGILNFIDENDRNKSDFQKPLIENQTNINNSERIQQNQRIQQEQFDLARQAQTEMLNMKPAIYPIKTRSILTRLPSELSENERIQHEQFHLARQAQTEMYNNNPPAHPVPIRTRSTLTRLPNLPFDWSDNRSRNRGNMHRQENEPWQRHGNVPQMASSRDVEPRQLSWDRWYNQKPSGMTIQRPKHVSGVTNVLGGRQRFRSQWRSGCCVHESAT